MQAVQRFFHANYWPVRYDKEMATRLLFDEGITHAVLLQYAHKDGISRGLNQFMFDTLRLLNASGYRATGLATVMPGEPEAEEIIIEAFTSLKLSGIKMHTHVQVIRANDPKMMQIYKVCQSHDKPALVHTGREPNSTGLKADTYELCSVDDVDEVCTAFPKLTYVVPHLGMNETLAYFKLLDKHPNLYLDTTMTLSDFFIDMNGFVGLSELRVLLNKYQDRVLYGSDFPNLPYHFGTELGGLDSMKLSQDVLDKILWRNACKVYKIDTESILKQHVLDASKSSL